MIIGVQGTSSFSDYNVFLRAMGVALSGMRQEDKEIQIYSFGPAKINSFVAEFCNLSERGMKARGKRIRFNKVPNGWAIENIKSMDYFAFFSQPNETPSKIVSIAELENIEVGIFRY